MLLPPRIKLIVLLVFVIVCSSRAATIGLSNLASTNSRSQPVFNFDLGSIFNRAQAQNSVTKTKQDWNSFFDSSSKPIFSENVVNVVHGSDNQLIGTQNQLEGNKNNVTGIQNSIFGDLNSVFGLKNNIFGSQNTILKGN